MTEKKQIVWITWSPRWPIAWPLLTFLVGFGALYAGTRFVGETIAQVLHWSVSTFFILIPSYFVLGLRRRGLETLGVTEKLWPQALGAGGVLGSLLGLAQLSRTVSTGHLLMVPSLGIYLAAIVVPLALIVAGEELLFRGWFQTALEPAIGFLPTLIVASLAYAIWPLALYSAGQIDRPVPFLPAGYMPPPSQGLLVLFFVALCLNIIYRLTGNLWSSGIANFLARFALLFAWAPADLIGSAPALTLAVALTLWAVVILSIRRWTQSAAAFSTHPPPKS